MLSRNRHAEAKRYFLIQLMRFASGFSIWITYRHDADGGTQRAALGALPLTLEIAPGVLAVHGTPGSDSEYLLEEKINERLALATALLELCLTRTKAKLILCGHSHNQHRARRRMATGSLSIPAALAVRATRTTPTAFSWRRDRRIPATPLRRNALAAGA